MHDFGPLKETGVLWENMQTPDSKVPAGIWTFYQGDESAYHCAMLTTHQCAARADEAIKNKSICIC